MSPPVMLFTLLGVLVWFTPCDTVSVSGFVMSQQWPETRCMEAKDSKHPCSIPRNITYWIIHGLWPSVDGDCKGSDFNWNSIKGMKSELDTYWTDLENRKGAPHFIWRHEWNKHGKCATSVRTVSNQALYFRKTISLRKSGVLKDIYSYLNACGITPGKEPYQKSKILHCLKEAIGVNVCLACFSKKHESYLMEVHVSLTTDFHVRDCHEKDTCHARTIIYPPIQ